MIFDETLTLYILRPIAFIIVKLLYPTNVTPNQVSYTAILFGLISAFFFSLGTLTGFLVGGLLYFFILILDCVDGMIARLKKNGTPIPENDIWIAALVKEYSLPLLSRDSHFDFVHNITRLTWHS